MTTSVSGTTRFVGRHRDLASFRRLLGLHRVVTLTGPGGVGKSRLAARLLEQGRLDAWHADVADVADPAMVESEVGHRLGLRAGPGDGATPADFFGARPGLLVIDNADRVLEACRDLIRDLLASCPGLRVVVTSRQALGLDGEQVLRLEPLTVPVIDDDLTVESASRTEAVRLFVDRAAAVAPGFRLTEDNVASVARLCSALDGLPLALELAAARTRELSPDAMLERIQDRYHLLAGRFRDVPDRLGSLEASVAWSHELCSPAEQLLWARLSVFVGGFGLPGAQNVCSGDGVDAAEIPELLESLVAKSLLSVDREVDPPHHRMLDTIREYGTVQLKERDDPQRWRERHGHWFAELATMFADEWPGPGQAWWLARMRLNHGNLAAALDSGHPERLRILVGAEMYWVVTGSLATARRWFERALESEQGDPALRFQARCIASYFASLLLDPDTARGEVAALRHEARPDDREARAWLAQTDGIARLFRGDVAGGIELTRPAVDDARGTGRHGLELNLRVLLAMLLMGSGDADGTRAALAACLDRSTELGDSHARSFALWISGRLARDTGDLEAAADLELEALALTWPLRDVLAMGMVLEALATIAGARGDQQQQGRLLGAAARLWRRVATTPVTASYTRAQRELAGRMARGEVDTDFVRGFREGVEADVDVTVAELLGRRSVSADAATPVPLLTARERQVAGLVGEGLTNQQIASRLVISVRTVHGHMENILRKLGFGSRAQVAAWVARQGA